MTSLVYPSAPVTPPAVRELSGRAAIVGVGETDYSHDYQAARARSPGYTPATQDALALTAFERALADSGLTRDDIDGLALSFIYGGASPQEVADLLGIRPRFAIQNGGLMAGQLPVVSSAIAEGRADTVALVYAAPARAIGRQFGGTSHSQSGTAPTSYYYHHPWGWSSQVAHWALVWSHYQQAFGAKEEDLAAVAMELRDHALKDPNAIMRTPLTLEMYMSARFIVRPLRLFDICLVNDGAVCLIMRKADMARDLAHPPVLVAGWSAVASTAEKMRSLVIERLRPQIQAASTEALAMAGISLADVQHLEAYDASSIHLISQLEGLGFAGVGEGLEFCKAGQMASDGQMPTNTGGGMLSQAYMHGWNQTVEIVRQLRGEAGARQVRNAEVSMLCVAQTDQVHPVLFRRGG